jgi:hypothetical protein
MLRILRTASVFLLTCFVFTTVSVFAAPVQDNIAGTWTDTFGDATGITSQTNTGVTSEALQLTNASSGFTPPFSTIGTASTVIVMPLLVSQWGVFTVASTTPAGTSIKVQVMDESGTLYPDSLLSGNTSGFTGGTIDLSGLPVDRNAATSGGYKIGRLKFLFTLTTSDTNVTPTITDVSLSWTLRTGDTSVSFLANTSWPASTNQNGSAKNKFQAHFFLQNIPFLSTL